MTKKAVAILAGIIVLTMGVYTGFASSGNGNPHNKVTICHATGSKSNPYVKNTPDASGVIDGHYPHQDNRDIIPPFDYVGKDGKTHHFPGQNWDANGQAIFKNGCNLPGSGTHGGTTTTTTTLPTTTVLVTTPGPKTTVTVTTSQTVTTPGGTKIIKKKKQVKAIHRVIVTHRQPQNTG